jgi:hypothetical protein
LTCPIEPYEIENYRQEMQSATMESINHTKQKLLSFCKYKYVYPEISSLDIAIEDINIHSIPDLVGVKLYYFFKKNPTITLATKEDFLFIQEEAPLKKYMKDHQLVINGRAYDFITLNDNHYITMAILANIKGFHQGEKLKKKLKKNYFKTTSLYRKSIEAVENFYKDTINLILMERFYVWSYNGEKVKDSLCLFFIYKNKLYILANKNMMNTSFIQREKHIPLIDKDIKTMKKIGFDNRKWLPAPLLEIINGPLFKDNSNASSIGEQWLFFIKRLTSNFINLPYFLMKISFFLLSSKIFFIFFKKMATITLE